MADLTYEQKTDRLMYTVYGNGEPGLCQDMADVKESMKDINLHHAKEPFLIQDAIDAAFNKRFGKRNSSVLLIIAITGSITGICSLLLRIMGV